MSSKRSAPVLVACAILSGTLLLFLVTDGRLAFLEDETTQVSLAQRPVLETLRIFASGAPGLEHPPLSDVLLHFWPPIAGAHPALLRVPAIVLYLTALLFYALVARQLAGDRAFYATLWIGSLWPFGLHFGRLIGWYSLSFLLVAILTWTYLRYLQNPSPSRWLAVLLSAVLLIYSNYYGWAIVTCLVADSFSQPKSRPVRFALLTLFCLALLYIPAWRAFGAEVARGSNFASRPLNSLYGLYSLFVSESIAPWFWKLSIPVALAIVACAGSLFAILRGPSLRMLFYFAISFAGMAAGGIVTTKRLLFISGWLLLSVAVAIASSDRKTPRNVLLISIAFLAAMGWFGFAARKYYAAPHFIEPWPLIADEAAKFVQEGGIVVSNSPSFLFQLNYSLERFGLVESGLPRYAHHPRVTGIDPWETAALRNARVLFVKGVNIDLIDQTAQAENWLRSLCKQTSAVDLVPDSGYELKSRLFPDSGQMPYRISVQSYACGGL